MKHRGGEPFGEHISKLQRGGNMKNSGFTKGNPISNKMEVNLDVLCPLVLDRVG
jgi:hypothetical protein